MTTPTPKPEITLSQIREAAQALANAHNDTAATAALLNAEIKAAIAPILERYKSTLDQYASNEAACNEQLDTLLKDAPKLFTKPRSLKVDGVAAGYRKEEDSLTWDDEDAVIAGIESRYPEYAPLMVRTEKSLIIDALPALSEDQRRRVGIRLVTGADKRFIKIGDNDAEKIVKLVVADAIGRQGEEEKLTSKKGKAPLKAAA